ncbi:MAG TPA: hypothetical protein VFF36_06025, partial [Planctomycetota bacterium]|nr:hypothetical protein [Planctomycetota bacterium]
MKAAPQVAQAEPGRTLDPREATLSAAIVLLLEHEHLLRKPIDDELSRTAFDTYLDRLDASKMFLLRKDRDALARYVDKVDDELRSGNLELAHEGQRIYTSRVEVVEKLVAELLAAPFNHDDEEWIELDPKKVEVATTEQELRDRWRRRLEFEVLEHVSQMETRLKAEQDRAQGGSGKSDDKAPGGKGGSASGKSAGNGEGGKAKVGSGKAAGTGKGGGLAT